MPAILAILLPILQPIFGALFHELFAMLGAPSKVVDDVKPQLATLNPHPISDLDVRYAGVL